MGDGVEPFIRGFVGVVGSGLVGIIHGAVDGTHYKDSIPLFYHQLADYAPFLGAAVFTASSKYGLWKTGARIGAALGTIPFAVGAELAGYLIGKIAVVGTKTVLNL